MWKFLRYWTGINLIVSMPFIAPLAAALHIVFNRRDCSCPPPQRGPKKEPPVLVTRTEAPPPPTITWKRLYKRVSGQTVEVNVKKAGQHDYAMTGQEPHNRSIRPFPVPSEEQPRRGRRRRMSR